MENQEDAGFRLLKFVVKFMGVVLVAGIFFLFFVVAKRIENPDFMRLKSACTLVSMEKIALGGSIASLTESERQWLAVVNKADGGQEILILDRCSGEVRRRIAVE